MYKIIIIISVLFFLCNSSYSSNKYNKIKGNFYKSLDKNEHFIFWKFINESYEKAKKSNKLVLSISRLPTRKETLKSSDESIYYNCLEEIIYVAILPHQNIIIINKNAFEKNKSPNYFVYHLKIKLLQIN